MSKIVLFVIFLLIEIHKIAQIPQNLRVNIQVTRMTIVRLGLLSFTHCQLITFTDVTDDGLFFKIPTVKLGSK